MNWEWSGEAVERDRNTQASKEGRSRDGKGERGIKSKIERDGTREEPQRRAKNTRREFGERLYLLLFSPAARSMLLAIPLSFISPLTRYKYAQSMCLFLKRVCSLFFFIMQGLRGSLKGLPRLHTSRQLINVI